MLANNDDQVNYYIPVIKVKTNRNRKPPEENDYRVLNKLILITYERVLS